jgi:hypothetical protein
MQIGKRMYVYYKKSSKSNYLCVEWIRFSNIPCYGINQYVIFPLFGHGVWGWGKGCPSACIGISW